MNLEFNSLPIGAVFFCNGNYCRKTSGRTARLLGPDRVFYFSKRELVRHVKDNERGMAHLCDCAERSWYGLYHDTACPLAGIARPDPLKK